MVDIVTNIVDFCDSLVALNVQFFNKLTGHSSFWR